MTVLEYDVVIAKDIHTLTAKVNAKLQGGWLLYGNFVIDRDNWLHQAMIKTVEQALTQ